MSFNNTYNNNIDSKGENSQIHKMLGYFPFRIKGMKKESYGYRDHLLIANMIKENCRSKQKSMVYLETFDSVRHECILKVVNILKLP